MCVWFTRRLACTLRRHGFHLATLQTRWVCARLGLAVDKRPSEMLVLMPDGTVVGGADAVILLAEHIWWARPLYLFARLPGMKRVLRPLYRFVARNRHFLGRCSDGACRASAK